MQSKSWLSFPKGFLVQRLYGLTKMEFTEIFVNMAHTLIFVALYIIGVWVAYHTGKAMGYDEFFRDFKRIEKESFEDYKKATEEYWKECSEKYEMNRHEEDC